MRKLVGAVVALLLAFPLALSVAGPASAHELTCTYGEHYSGHNNVYMMVYRSSFKDIQGRTVHHLDRYSHRNWLGNYTHYDYSVDVWGC